MVEEAIRVLVVDDSALMRNLIGKMVDSAPDLEVVGKAMNGVFALQKLERLSADVIVLDIEMPQMNGLEFLEERKKRGIDIPVVVLSSVAQRGAKVTMDALALGASDFITKPSGSISHDIHEVRDVLVEMLRSYGGRHRRRHGLATMEARQAVSADVQRDTAPTDAPTAEPPRSSAQSLPAAEPPAPPRAIVPEAAPGPIELVAIGISTGGPNALRKVFAGIDADIHVPIVVVQHMPAGFTTEFARSLDRVCPLEVKEAEEGDILKPGRVLIAPGNRHLTVEKRALAGVVHIDDGDHRNGHRPSVDKLFESVAAHYGNRALAVIMTGMGRDGAMELGAILRKGGITVGQDEHSSVVFGMPRVAFELGHVQHQVALERMAETISQLAKEHR